MDRRKIIAFSIAITLIIIAIISRAYLSRRMSLEFRASTSPSLGEPGSEHSHMSMLVFVNEGAIDFSDAQFQLKDEHVHFEDGDGITIHKHAKGVTLAFMFRTLGMELTPDCLTTKEKVVFCSDGQSTLRQYLNREPFVDWNNYELNPSDKILIDYGTSTETDILLKLNGVPDLPDDL